MSKRGGKKNTNVKVGASEEIMSRAYRSVAHETPPPELDARILAHARDAVGATDTPVRSRNRWALPLSVAAVMVLSVSVVINIALKPDEQELYNLTSAVTAHEQTEMRDQPAAAPAKRSVAKLSEEKREAEPLASSQDTVREAPAAAASAPTMEEYAPAAESMERAKTKQDYAEAEADRSVAGASVASSKPAPVRATSAAVVSVVVEGSPGAYWFSVGVRSNDTGCAQYADWWEIVGENGVLLYRYVSTHSHTDKQPFVLDGGPVRIQPDMRVWVRAHMNKTGYSSAAFFGSVGTGFKPAELASNFAIGLAKQAPLPDGCAY